MKISIIIATIAVFVLSRPASAEAPDTQTETFNPFRETPAEYNARVQWFRDAKLGIFVHWNPSSINGTEISWSRGDVGNEKYDNLYKQFKAENFNADEWIKIFHDAGAKYAVFVPKHHDGFCMFNTKTSDYNVMHTPFGRDYIKEISAACAKSDVRFCLYYSILDWTNPAYHGNSGADLTEYEKVMKTHLTELLTHYGPVGCMWFDGNWEGSWTHAHGRDLYAFVRRLQPDMLVGNRVEPRRSGDGPYCKDSGSFYNAPDAVGDYQAREMDIGKFYTDKAWDSCYSLNAGLGDRDHWSWVPPIRNRPLPDIINWLVQCIGRDGNMLLGVGPRPDGTIDPDSVARLRELGGWLKTHGEAVYGTRAGPYWPDDWGVSTRKGNKVFVFVTNWNGGILKLPALPFNVTSARILGETTGEALSFTPTDSLWTLKAPEALRGVHITVVELTLDHNVMHLPMAMNLPTVEASHVPSISQGKPVEVSGEWKGREEELSKTHVNDGNFDMIWAGPENSRDGWVQIDLGKDHTIGNVLLDEGRYQRCEKFEVQAQVDGKWKTLATGTTIGNRKYLTIEPTKARLFRVVIDQASDVPTLAEFQLFEQPEK
ncbi:MAG: alpha-L-fucosidase [Chthoniobacteraceae bacterium]|jgi:alpha-L-fucosidase